MHKKAIGTVGRMFADTVSDQFMDCLVEMLLFTQSTLCSSTEYINYIKATMSWHEMGRNQLVMEALGDWVFQLDTDHIFAPDVLVRLLALKKRTPGCRVISGVYQYKFAPHAPVVNLWDEKGGVVPLQGWNRDQEILTVGPIPGGCLLVDRDVYREVIQKTGQQPFTLIQGYSEDYSFCKRCKDLGIPVHLATRIQAHHLLKRVPLFIQDYLGHPMLPTALPPEEPAPAQ